MATLRIPPTQRRRRAGRNPTPLMMALFDEPQVLDFEDMLADDFDSLEGFVVMPSEIRDVLNRVKRGADSLARDIAAAPADQIPASERAAFQTWYQDFNATYETLTTSWLNWRLGFASAMDTAERNLAELGEWRARFTHFTQQQPSGPDPSAAISRSDDDNPVGTLSTALKWAAILGALYIGYTIYRDFRR